MDLAASRSGTLRPYLCHCLLHAILSISRQQLGAPLHPNNVPLQSRCGWPAPKPYSPSRAPALTPLSFRWPGMTGDFLGGSSSSTTCRSVGRRGRLPPGSKISPGPGWRSRGLAKFKGIGFDYCGARGGNKNNISALTPELLRAPEIVANTRVARNIHNLKGEEKTDFSKLS